MYACIYELRKNCCGWTGRDGTGGESKVLQEVLADLKKSPGFPLTLTHSLQIGYRNFLCHLCLWKYLPVYIYQYIPGKLEYIQVWETRPTQFPQDPPQRSQFDLDRQFRPWKKEIISDKEKYINNSTNRMRKKESYTQWDLPTKKLISHNTGTLCRIFRCGNWSEPSCVTLAITHYRPWIICYMCFYFEQ